MITLVLYDDYEGEEFARTKVEDKAGISSYTLGNDNNTNEIIAYVFDSNVEISRYKDYTEEMICDEIFERYTLHILHNEDELNDYDNKIGIYQ